MFGGKEKKWRGKAVESKVYMTTLRTTEYKFAEYKDRIFKTYKTQLILHALMIKETYNIEVNRGYLCYTRSNNLVKEIWFRNRDFENAISILNNIIEIIQKGFYPKKTRYLKRCIDCCYRNICV